MSGNKDDPNRYDDIIELSRPVSINHPRMSIENRAAQFSPFAALTGYDGAIKETARLTDKKIELDDDEKIMINEKLQLILENTKECPEVTITFFQADIQKDGGAYYDAVGSIKKIDTYERSIVMASGKTIPIDDIVAISGELFMETDEGFI